MKFNDFEHPFCFLVYRHVTNDIQNFFGYLCLKKIRSFYQNAHVYFIDDCSPIRDIPYLDDYSSIIYSDFEEPYGSNLCWYHMYTKKL